MSKCFYCGYRELYSSLTRMGVDRQYQLHSSMIENHIKAKVNTFLKMMENLFSSYDYSRNGTWNPQQFRDFCLNSRVDSIIFEFESIKVKVPIYLKI